MKDNKDLSNNESNEEKELDYNDNRILDKIVLDKDKKMKGLIKFILFSLISILVFFVPITIDGNTDMGFGIIYKFFKNTLGIAGLWLICFIITANGVLCVLSKIFKDVFQKKYKGIYDYYESDSIIHAILYLVGAAFVLLYTADITFKAFSAPGWLMNKDVANSVISSVVIDTTFIIMVGSFFIAFLINSGLVDFVGAFMQPIMRPAFKIPGRSAVNCIGSIVCSASVGVLMTDRFYKEGIYTQKETAIIATGFSAVSVGFSYMVVKTAGLQSKFLPIYFIAMIVTFLVTAVVVRFPPLKNKSHKYIDGRLQTKEDLENEKIKSGKGLFKTGASRAVKKAYLSPKIGKELKLGLKDGASVVPKVISLMTAVGILGLLIAHYTPIFDWIGMIILPLLKLLRIPDAVEIASSFFVGIAEMFLPVLLISDKINVISEAARFLVVVVSQVQIIFFSDSAVVMLALKMPVSVKDLVIIFIERTIVAIIITAPIMHLLF